MSLAPLAPLRPSRPSRLAPLAPLAPLLHCRYLVVTLPLQGFLERTMTKKNRKDFLSTAGPFLLVITFLEDGSTAC